MDNFIHIKGAKTHNLKDVSIDIPKDKLVVFTGVSGSGKSSLVFDTIYTEAQRQLVDTFSSFARRRLPKLSRPPVDEITNISTPIVIDQKQMGRTLRSNVGTATELLTYLRLLFSRCGTPSIGPSFFFSFNNPEGMCIDCMGLGKRIQIDIDLLLDKSKSLREGAITHPSYKVDGWNWRELIGCALFDNDRPLQEFSDEDLNTLLYTAGIPIDKKHGAGIYSKAFEGVARKLERYQTNRADDELPQSDRNAYEKYLVYTDCPTCEGTRLNERARSVTVDGQTISELSSLELIDFSSFLHQLEKRAGAADAIAKPIVSKMLRICGHLIEIGVGYLSLNRAVSTLSGGESQRVKMARQLDCDLTGLMYILDEPTMGLHPRDSANLVEMLHKLVDKGNSVLVVEHDSYVILSADWVVDVGPVAGADGGYVLFNGTVKDLMTADTTTAKYLLKDRSRVGKRRTWSDVYEVKGAMLHNLKGDDVIIPMGALTCVTGVAGSGKSSLIHGVFAAKHPEAIVVDQAAPARSSRSNPCTYLGIFDQMRKEISKATGAKPALFSFNSEGACPKCNGMGVVSVEMHFMDDVKMECDECAGRRYKPEVLEYLYKGRSIYDILDLSVEEAIGFFDTPDIARRLSLLRDVGLGYIKLGQSFSTLSGGESQRVKLASELHKSGSLYIMDEPTTGLHMADIERFMDIVHRLVDSTNTVVIIEHNPDVIAQADWVIDMGPGGGKSGGHVIYQGTPEGLATCESSHTARYITRE